MLTFNLFHNLNHNLYSLLSNLRNNSPNDINYLPTLFKRSYPSHLDV